MEAAVVGSAAASTDEQHSIAPVVMGAVVLGPSAQAVAGSVIYATPLGDPVPAGAGRARRRLQECLGYSVLFFIAAIVVVLFVQFSNLGVAVLEPFGEEIQAKRDDAAVIAAVVGLSTLFSALPIPGTVVWRLLVGFVYGFNGFIVLLIGHCVGMFLAFQIARLAWRSGLDQAAEKCRWCRWCCFDRAGRPNKATEVLLGSLRLSEERPFRTVLLLGLAPVPWFLTAYLLGAKAARLHVVQFMPPITLSGVKMALHVFLGSRLSHLEELSSAKGSPLELALLLGSSLLGLLALLAVARFALHQVQQDLGVPRAVALEASPAGSSASSGAAAQEL